MCPTGKNCKNQRLTNREYPLLEIINCGDRGLGLATGATTSLRRGDFIHEYIGEIISNNELEKRSKNYFIELRI